MQISEILCTKVTYQKNYWTELFEVSLADVFEEIKGLKHANYTKELSQLYSNGDYEMYSIKKRYLPVAAFSGTFSQVRSKSGLNSYSSIIVLDVDKLNLESLKITQKAFIEDPHVLCFWKSPSQNGIKALVKINYNKIFEHSSIDLYHKQAFTELANYFYENYKIELDKSGSDFTRLCFVSSDPEFFLKQTFQSFNVDLNKIPITKEEKVKVMSIVKRPGRTSKANLYDATGKNLQQHKKVIQNIISYLGKNSKSITFNYDDWLRVAFAIANSFTYDIGIKYFKDLSKNDINKFDPVQCENLLNDCYNNSKNLINFATIIHLAKTQGFVAHRTNREST